MSKRPETEEPSERAKALARRIDESVASREIHSDAAYVHIVRAICEELGLKPDMLELMVVDVVRNGVDEVDVWRTLKPWARTDVGKALHTLFEVGGLYEE